MAVKEAFFRFLVANMVSGDFVQVVLIPFKLNRTKFSRLDHFRSIANV